MSLLHHQVTLADMQGYVRFCIPDSACDTIQVWTDVSGPHTYALGSEGLVMLAQNGIFPRKDEELKWQI